MRAVPCSGMDALVTATTDLELQVVGVLALVERELALEVVRQVGDLQPSAAHTAAETSLVDGGSQALVQRLGGLNLGLVDRLALPCVSGADA